MTPDRRRALPRPATVISVVALVVASAGSATAASLISGKQVKNNSLTGADIKNSSLRGADIRNRSLTQSDLSTATVNALKGKQGPAGPAGPQGPQGLKGDTGAKGDKGDIGPSTAFTKAITSYSIPDAASEDFGTFALTPGAYVVTAKFTVTNGLNPGSVSCSLNRLIGPDPLRDGLDTVDTDGLASGEIEEIVLHAAFTDTEPFSYDITCARTGTDFVTAKNVRITAIKVGEVKALS